MTKADACKIDWKELKIYEFWKKNKEYLVVKNDVLMLISKDKVEVPIVPKHLTNKICELYHDSVSAGHLGYEKTFISIQKKFYNLHLQFNSFIIFKKKIQ